MGSEPGDGQFPFGFPRGWSGGDGAGGPPRHVLEPVLPRLAAFPPGSIGCL